MVYRVDANLTATSLLKGSKLGLDVAMENLATIDKDTPAKHVVSHVLQNGQVQFKTAEIVNERVQEQARKSFIDFSEVAVKLDAFTEIENGLGKQGDDNSLIHLGSNISQSFHLLATSTKENFLNAKSNTFNAINNFLYSGQSFSQKLQDVRQQAEEKIAKSIDDTNSCLQKIAEFNLIASTNRENKDVAVEEHRSMLNKLAQNIGFYTKEQPDGSLRVYSDSTGYHLLVDKGNFATINYTPNHAINPASTFNPITITFLGQTYQAPNPQDGTDVTNFFSTLSGPLSSNLYIRDTFAPALQGQMNKVFAYMVTNFNEFHNQGTSTVLRSTIQGDGIPGSKTITGSESLDPSTLSGTVRFALMNSKLQLAPPPY
ncbi:MAG: hypothetical protein HEEMFOPI_00426 [Holosporales bacterium]